MLDAGTAILFISTLSQSSLALGCVMLAKPCWVHKQQCLMHCVHGNGAAAGIDPAESVHLHHALARPGRSPHMPICDVVFHVNLVELFCSHLVFTL